MKQIVRFVWLAVLVFSLGLPAQESRAQGTDLGLYGAYIDAQDLKEAYGFGAKIKMNLAPLFAVDLRGSYLEFDDSLPTVTLIPVELALLLQLPVGILNLYGGAGMGYYIWDTDHVELDEATGFFPIAGVELVFGSIKLFGEARWMVLESDTDGVFDEIEDAIDEREYEDDGVGVNVGLAISL